jgi:hypothetical protein
MMIPEGSLETGSIWVSALDGAVNKGHPVNRRNRRVRIGILGLRTGPWGSARHRAIFRLKRSRGWEPLEIAESGGYRRLAESPCCQEFRGVELKQEGCGSPAWIRTTNLTGF